MSFVPPMIVPVRAESDWEKYGAFLNSFPLKVKLFIRRLERIKDKIGNNEVYVLFNQTGLTGLSTYTHEKSNRFPYQKKLIFISSGSLNFLVSLFLDLLANPSLKITLIFPNNNI